MKFPSVKIIVLGILLVAISLSPQLFFGKFFSNGDPFLFFYPVFKWFSSHIISGDVSMWSGGILGGFPFAADLIGGFFSPITRLTLTVVNNPLSAYAIMLFIAYFLTFISTYGFLRTLGNSKAASVSGAIIFLFGYQLMPWSSNLVVANAFFILPFLLFIAAKMLRGDFAWIIVGGLGLGYALIAGQPQWVLMGFVGLGLYILYEIIHILRSAGYIEARKLFYRCLVGFLAIFIIALIIAWPQLSFSQKISEYSSRSEGISFSQAQISAQTPLDWLWYLLPELNIKYLSAQEPTLYIGVIPLILAGCALLRPRSPIVAFGFPLFVFGIVAALKFSPIFWLIHHLPVFSFFRGSNRWIYLANFGLAIIAASGFDKIRSGFVPDRVFERSFKIISFSVLVVGIISNLISLFFEDSIVSVLSAYFDKNLYTKTAGLPLTHYHDVIAAHVHGVFRNFSVGNIHFILPLAFLFLGIWYLKSLASKGYARRNFSYLTLGLIVANIIPLHANFYQTVPSSTVLRKPVFVQTILQNDNIPPERSRIIGVMSGTAIDQKLRTPFRGSFTDADVVEFSSDLFEPNLGLVSGIDTIDGYDNLMPKRTARVIAYVGSERATTGDSLSSTPIPLQDKLSLFVSRLNILSMLNVKYIVSAYELPKTEGLSLISTVSSTRFNIPIYLYQNNRVLPRIYFAPSVEFLSSSDEITNFNILTEPARNFSKISLIECAGCTEKGATSQRDTLSVQEYKDGFLRVKTKTAYSRWLIFSESNLPGWKFTIDSKEASSHPANYLFHAIFVPPGEHVLEVRYTGKI